MIAAEHLNAADEGDESQAFLLSYSVLRELIDHGLVDEAFRSQQSVELHSQVSVSQQALLKVLDGHIHTLTQQEQDQDLDKLAEPVMLIQQTVGDKLANNVNTESTVLAGQLHAAVLTMHCLSQIGTASIEGRQAMVGCIKSSSGGSISETLKQPQANAPATDILRASEQIRSRLVSTESNGHQAFNAVRRAFAEFMTVAMFEQKRAQDVARETAALFQLLPMCRIDDQNPSASRLPTPYKIRH